LYPRLLSLYIELQIWDLKAKQKVWGGICNGETQIFDKKEETGVYQDLSDRLAECITGESKKYRSY
jgi:hypothetical protein